MTTHLCVGTCILLSCFGFINADAALKQPNILFIVGDDVGVGDLASYGHPSQEWGAIDQMAAEGVRFTQAYSSARFCTPSRASILTGKFKIMNYIAHICDLPPALAIS